MGFPNLADPPITDALKHLFERVRPTADLHHSLSFPSGHATGAAFLFTTLFLASGALLSEGPRVGAPPPAAPTRQLAWASAFGVACVVLGRLAADVHYASDCLGGLALGVGAASACAVGSMRLERALLSMSPDRDEYDGADEVKVDALIRKDTSESKSDALGTGPGEIRIGARAQAPARGARDADADALNLKYTFD